MLCNPAELAKKSIPQELKQVETTADALSRDLLIMLIICDLRSVLLGKGNLQIGNQQPSSLPPNKEEEMIPSVTAEIKRLPTPQTVLQVGDKVPLEGVLLLPCLYAENATSPARSTYTFTNQVHSVRRQDHRGCRTAQRRLQIWKSDILGGHPCHHLRHKRKGECKKAVHSVARRREWLMTQSSKKAELFFSDASMMKESIKISESMSADYRKSVQDSLANNFAAMKTLLEEGGAN
jgi:hypothetical protein